MVDRLKVFSNGDDFILVVGSDVFLAKNCFLKSYFADLKSDSYEMTFFGDNVKRIVPGLRWVDISLDLTCAGLEKADGKMDIDEFLFRKVEILKTIEIVRKKMAARGSA